MPLRLVVDTPRCRLYHGPAEDYEAVADPAEPIDEVDLVLTNPYAAFPKALRSKPTIVSHFADRKGDVESIVGDELTEVARWGLNGRQAVWTASMRLKPIDLTFIGEEMFADAKGWWPLDLPMRLLAAALYSPPGWAGCWNKRLITVIDPFMGRGTVGRACQLHGQAFVGIDINAERVALARRYLGA